jgi:hypothetical protein
MQTYGCRRLLVSLKRRGPYMPGREAAQSGARVTWLYAGCMDCYGEDQPCFRCVRAQEDCTGATSYALDMSNARNVGPSDMWVCWPRGIPFC